MCFTVDQDAGRGTDPDEFLVFPESPATTDELTPAPEGEMLPEAAVPAYPAAVPAPEKMVMFSRYHQEREMAAMVSALTHVVAGDYQGYGQLQGESPSSLAASEVPFHGSLQLQRMRPTEEAPATGAATAPAAPEETPTSSYQPETGSSRRRYRGVRQEYARLLQSSSMDAQGQPTSLVDQLPHSSSSSQGSAIATSYAASSVSSAASSQLPLLYAMGRTEQASQQPEQRQLGYARLMPDGRSGGPSFPGPGWPDSGKYPPSSSK